MEEKIKLYDDVKLKKDIFYQDSEGEYTFKKGSIGTVIEIEKAKDCMVEIDINDSKSQMTFGQPYIQIEDLELIKQ